MEDIKDKELFDNYSNIKKATKLCEIMVSGGKASVCRNLYDNAMTGEIKPDEFVDVMKGKFKTNKKLVKALDFLNKQEREVI